MRGVHYERFHCTCVSSAGEANEQTVTLEEVSDDHIDILVFLVSPAAHETQMFSSRHRTWGKTYLGFKTKTHSMWVTLSYQ